MGKLFVIEGLDGSGKATQAKLLAQRLKGMGKRVREVSFPQYDSESSALVKMYLNGEFGSRPDDVNAYAASTFYAVDRYASFKKDWREAWEKGIVIADRYTTSNAIHQCSKLPTEQWDPFLEWLFELEYEHMGIPKPELVVYLQVDPDVSQRLMAVRYHGEDKRDIHEKNLQYLERCQIAAEYCVKTFGWTVIECCKDGQMRPIEEIGAEIMNCVTPSL